LAFAAFLALLASVAFLALRALLGFRLLRARGRRSLGFRRLFFDRNRRDRLRLVLGALGFWPDRRGNLDHGGRPAGGLDLAAGPPGKLVPGGPPPAPEVAPPEPLAPRAAALDDTRLPPGFPR